MFGAQKKFIDDLQFQLMKELEMTIRAFDFVLKDYIINKQLFTQGIDGDGIKLPGYKRTTIRIKIAKGDPVDRTTLRDKGEFYAHIRIDAFSDRFEVGSDVSHDKFIFKRYGLNVLKITNENIREFMNVYFLPNLKEYVSKQITR
jgi:hypothetical protein